MRHGFAGDYARLVAALLPCFWVYREVGHILQGRGTSPEPLHQAWIETYAGEKYGAAIEAQLRIIDRIGQENARRHDELSRIVREGVSHERAFWDQAYRFED